MEQLSTTQRALVEGLARELSAIEGVAAVVLGGSYARGRATAASDIDLGVLYSERAPFAVAAIRALAARVDDTDAPVVTELYEWGPWVNGGAWLSIGDQRVDLLYRSLEHLGRVIDDAAAGCYELHYGQQPPFGFFSGTYLGELAVCVPLFERDGRLAALKARVGHYPEPLRAAVVQGALWDVEFGLTTFASKFAARGDAFGTSACLARAGFHLILALFALNRVYLVNDKTALAESEGFASAPRDFAARLRGALAHPGASPAELAAAVARVQALFHETVAACDGLYAPRYPLPA
jgi:hypothetical protein